MEIIIEHDFTLLKSHIEIQEKTSRMKPHNYQFDPLKCRRKIYSMLIFDNTVKKVLSSKNAVYTSKWKDYPFLQEFA